MEPFLYSFFHDRTNDRKEGGLVFIPKDTELWPDEWKKNETKTYSRVEKIALPPVREDGVVALAQQRTAAVSAIHKQNITFSDIAVMLQTGYGVVAKGDEKHRTVPSGGARYPLEVYLCVWGDIASLPIGQYHYDALANTLDTLPQSPVTKSDISLFTNDDWVRDSHGVILLSAFFKRSTNKYGSRGYRYILLEAGHAGQNICLAAAERNLAVRPLGGFSEAFFEASLNLDVTAERIVYALIF